jgi:hypothetical protein
MAKDLDVLVITDSTNTAQERDIIQSILNRVRMPDIGWGSSKIKVLSDIDKKAISDLSKVVVNKDLFLDRYTSAERRLDMDILERYAKKNNPQLHTQLKETNDIGSVLWKEFNVKIQQGGWEAGFNYYGVLNDEAKKHDYPNVIEVLFSHNIISPDFGNDEYIPYHMIARGFVAEGWHSQLRNKSNTLTGTRAIVLPLGLYDTPEAQKACARELIHHEIIGHALAGLKDHIGDGTKPDDCIMAIPESREEFVRIALGSRPLTLCEPCNEQYLQTK